MRSKPPHRGRSRGSHRSVVVLCLALVVLAGLWMPTTSYTSALGERSSNIDVVADDEGVLGLNASASVSTGQTDELVTLANRLGADASLTVSLAGESTSTGDLVVDGVNEGDEATFDLAVGANQTVEFETPCDDGLVGQTVTYTVEVSTGTVDGTVTRTADVVDGDCRQAEVVFVSKTDQNTSTIRRTGEDETAHLDHKVAEIGPARTSLDGDDATEVPYVHNNYVKSIGFGESSPVTLTSQNVNNEPVGIGDYDGDGADEIYYNQQKNLYAVRDGESPTKVVDSSNFTDASGHELVAVAGATDVDGDGAVEIVYSDSNRGLAYVEENGSLVQTGYQLGDTNSFGRPADFDGDGTVRIPVVTDTGKVALVDADGQESVLNATYESAALDSVSAHDIDGDGTLEVVFADVNEALHYMELDGSHAPVGDADGVVISANKNKGAA